MALIGTIIGPFPDLAETWRAHSAANHLPAGEDECRKGHHRRGPTPAKNVDDEGPNHRADDRGETADRGVKAIELAEPLWRAQFVHEDPVAGPGGS